MAVKRENGNPKIRLCLLIKEGVVPICPLKREGFCGDFNQQSMCARPIQERQQGSALDGFGATLASPLIRGVKSCLPRIK
jgi:hypothetical protein